MSSTHCGPTAAAAETADSLPTLKGAIKGPAIHSATTIGDRHPRGRHAQLRWLACKIGREALEVETQARIPFHASGV